VVVRVQASKAPLVLPAALAPFLGVSVHVLVTV
jgi:hypothetical protein